MESFDNAIEIRDLNKIFRIYDSPRDRLKEAFSPSRKKYSTEFAALKNINLEVKKGEFLGIVGRNGAGKSTLLKILSGEMGLTSGQLKISGSVSLLQLGVGFNPEQSGRENAIFSSKIMGYSSSEIEVMLEKIIEFADIGEFIDHPVKTYSSGMHSRLSFAVGVNINPDILIADEVLSVGDIRFSQKCLRKMHEFRKSGKTVVLVTHDTASVAVFCDKAIWIRDGEVFRQGKAKEVSEEYKNFMLYNRLPSDVKEAEDASVQIGVGSARSRGDIVLDNEQVVPKKDIVWVPAKEFSQLKSGQAQVRQVTLIDGKTLKNGRIFSARSEMHLIFDVEVRKAIENPFFGYVLYDAKGLVALHSNNSICNRPIEALKPNQLLRVRFRVRLPDLNRGQFVFALGVFDHHEVLNRINEAISIEVVNESAKKEQCGYMLVTDEDFHASHL